jgi:hypothetical protein
LLDYKLISPINKRENSVDKSLEDALRQIEELKEDMGDLCKDILHLNKEKDNFNSNSYATLLSNYSSTISKPLLSNHQCLCLYSSLNTQQQQQQKPQNDVVDKNTTLVSLKSSSFQRNKKSSNYCNLSQKFSSSSLSSSTKKRKSSSRR